MRIRRVYLLLLFVFSLISTNIYYSHSKPPLLEKNTSNIIILADNNSNSQEIITLNLDSNDNTFVNNNYKDFIPILLIAFLSSTEMVKSKVRVRPYNFDKIKGLKGIVSWYPDRILRN